MVFEHEDVTKTRGICNTSSSIFGDTHQVPENQVIFARIAEVVSTVVAPPTKKKSDVLDNPERMGIIESSDIKDYSRPVKIEVKSKQAGFADARTGLDKKTTSRKYSKSNKNREPVDDDEEEVEADEEQVVIIRHKKDEALKSFICGGFAGIISRTAVAPLDLIKTHLITSHGIHRRKSGFDIFTEIWKAEGWRGLFRGNGINCIRVAPCKAIELCVFETVKKILDEEGHPLQRFAAPLAGGAAGMAGTLVTYPLELIRTRISLRPQYYDGLRGAVSKICKEEGFLALYAGLTPSMLGVFPYAAANYFVYDGLRSSYCRTTGTRHVPTGLTLLFGAVAAAASSAITYPLEVARRQMQLGSAAMVTNGSTINLLRHIHTEEGFLALYRGLGTSWLKLIPAAGISFVCYEAARSAWEREMEKERKNNR